MLSHQVVKTTVVFHSKLGKPISFSFFLRVGRKQFQLMVVWVKDAGKSECHFVMKWIEVEIFFGVSQNQSRLLPTKVVPTSYE